MKIRRFVCVLLVWVTVIGSLIETASAAGLSKDWTISMEDMECETINLPGLEHWEEWPAARSSASISKNVPAVSFGTLKTAIPLKADDTITFNCSYSPSSASVDFGIIAPDGKFYSINVRGGSINQSIRLSQTGDYSVAIRNNSLQAVYVVRFVYY